MDNKAIVIIGAGVAGVMAAIAAGEENKKVILIDQNDRIGKKLSVTGGGRCNLTNIGQESEFIKSIISNGKFLYKAFNTFSNQDLISFFEGQGIKLKVEEEGKIFPQSNKSEDIIDAFIDLLKQYNVDIRLNCKATKIIVNNNKVVGVKIKDNSFIEANSVIIATGGKSYPHTGSTGDGYIFSQDLGHTIIDIKPSLVSVNIKEEWIKDLMGISLTNTVVSYKNNKGKKSSIGGPMLFTHYGISGPSILKLSAYINKEKLNMPLVISVDMSPQYTDNEINSLLVPKDSREGQYVLKAVISKIIPKNLCSKLLEVFSINADIKLNSLKKEERFQIVSIIKDLKLTITSLRSIKEAIITAGGVSVKEINPSTMESKIIEGLFFAGEVIDIDALTGGYNLQIAFSTGYVAGKNA